MDNDHRRGSLVNSFIYPVNTFTKPDINLSRPFQVGNENYQPSNQGHQHQETKSSTVEDLPVPVFQRRGSMLVPGGVHSAEYRSRSTTMAEGRPQPGLDQGRRLSDYFSALAPSNWFGPKQN